MSLKKRTPKRGQKSAGRKSPWTQVQINDLIDIIVENDEFKRNLISGTQSFKEMGSCMGKLNVNWRSDMLQGMREFLSL